MGTMAKERSTLVLATAVAGTVHYSCSRPILVAEGPNAQFGDHDG